MQHYKRSDLVRKSICRTRFRRHWSNKRFSILIHEDTKAAYSENPTHHLQIKHLEGELMWIRENLVNELVSLEYCEILKQLADIGTKDHFYPQYSSITGQIMTNCRDNNA